jgi:hypothetical protein
MLTSLTTMTVGTLIIIDIFAAPDIIVIKSGIDGIHHLAADNSNISLFYG